RPLAIPDAPPDGGRIESCQSNGNATSRLELTAVDGGKTMRRSKISKEIELRHLRTFALAATEGGFSAAAAALGLSVPAVWEQVRSLESILGAALLVRRGRALELTADGKL